MAEPSIVLMQKAMLLQFIGKIYFFENNIEESLRYFELGEQVELGELMSYLATANFFTEWLKDYARAIAKCDEIIALATSSPFAETEDNRGSDSYIAIAEKLKQFCLSQQADE